MEEKKPEEFYAEKVATFGTRWLRSSYAGWILAAISFAESLFAPIIIDPFLVALIFAKRESWVRFISIAVIFSVLGGVAGYLLGALFYDTVGRPLLELYGFTDGFEAVANELTANGFVFVLLGALTPVPYKLVAIASGLVQVNFVTFLFASIIGRFLRLALVGLAAHVVGPHALPLIRRHLLTCAYIVAFLLLLYIAIRII